MIQQGDVVRISSDFLSVVYGVMKDFGVVIEKFEHTCNIYLIIGGYEISTQAIKNNV